MNQAEAYGGSQIIDIAADFQVSRHLAWQWSITATAGGLAVQLPDARRLIPGYPVIQIVNPGVTAFAIEDATTGALIATVAQDEVYTFGLVDSSTEAGGWVWGQWTQHAASAPAQTAFPWTLGGQDTGMVREAWKYDFIGDSWSQLGGTITEFIQPNTARADTTGIAIVADIKTVIKYFDPNVWSDHTDSNFDHRRGAGGREQDGNDRGYFYGATSTVVADTNEVEHHDISGDSWVNVTDMLRNRHKAQVGSNLSTLHFVIGGAISTLSFHDAVINNDQYDISGDSHTTKTSMNTARLDFALGISSFTGDLWCYAGAPRNNVTATDDVESYSISGDSWTIRTDYPQTVASQNGATRIDNNLRIYVIGSAGGSNQDAVYKHNPQNDSYTNQTDHGASVANARLMGVESLTN